MTQEIGTDTTILVVEDDPADRLLIEKALRQNGVKAELMFCSDGEDVLNYLHRRADYQEVTSSPRPALILLDLNLPKINGRKVLQEIKDDPELKAIPTIVLTTSSAREDIEATYASGGNSFLTKPATFEDLVKLMARTECYWLKTVELPNSSE